MLGNAGFNVLEGNEECDECTGFWLLPWEAVENVTEPHQKMNYVPGMDDLAEKGVLAETYK